MIKKVFIWIIAAGMILTTIPTVNAENEITLNEVTDQIIDISDKYNSAGITSGQLLNLITLTQTDDELLDTLSLDKNNLFDTSIPKKVNIQSSRSGDLYDGNPPASKGEQKDRMKYIRSVYDNEYNNENHDEAYKLIFEYIETFYNIVRTHSHCNYQSPNQYEKIMQKTVKLDEIFQFNLYFFLT